MAASGTPNRTRSPRDQAIIAAYRAGHSLREIARDLGIHHSVVRDVLHRHNEPCRAAGRPAKASTTQTIARDAGVIAAYRDGQSLDAVSRTLGIGKTTVWKILVRHGEPRRLSLGRHDVAIRDEALIAGYRAGQTLAKLSAAFGISRTRVRQILRRHGQSTDGRQE
jgi:transposase